MPQQDNLDQSYDCDTLTTYTDETAIPTSCADYANAHAGTYDPSRSGPTVGACGLTSGKPACDACLAGACCPSLGACNADTACVQLLACLKGCPTNGAGQLDMSCTSGCADAAGAIATAEYNTIAACDQANCATACM